MDAILKVDIEQAAGLSWRWKLCHPIEAVKVAARGNYASMILYESGK